MTDFQFQSTPSVWKATVCLPFGLYYVGISIHAFRVEGDYSYIDINSIAYNISIHAFRVEGDCKS